MDQEPVSHTKAVILNQPSLTYRSLYICYVKTRNAGKMHVHYASKWTFPILTFFRPAS